MRNHFFFSYPGNKRNEFNEIIKSINFDNINNIIEPFCGSSSISFNIWLKYGNKYNYYLNDNDKELISIYQLFKHETIETISNELLNIDNKITNKDEWNNYFKSNNTNNIYKELYFRKYSTFGRKGFYPLNRKIKKYIPSPIQQLFLNFIKSPNVYISNDDWFDIFDKYKDDEKSLLILDPPYINTNNDFYVNKTLNVYEYFYKNKIELFKSQILLILEDIWVIRLLFSNNNIVNSYGKTYELSKKKTSHIVICNH